MSIVPLTGYCVGKPTTKLTSIEAESANAMGLHGFTVVDSKAGRNDSLSGKTRVRKFEILSMYDDAEESLKSYVGKNVYCVCFENENENNIIVDRTNGDKLWILPVVNMLGYDKE